MSKVALIILDWQEDFVPDSVDALHGRYVKALNFVEKLAEEADLVIATQCIHPKDHSSFSEFGEHCVKGTKGARLNPQIKELADYVPTKGDKVEPEQYSGFMARTLRPLEWVEEILKVEKVTKVQVVGLGHGWDVPQTAFDANALGYPTYIYAKGTLKLSDPTREQLKHAGVNVID